MTIIYEGGDTIITVPVADQVALHVLLNRIGDLNLTLLSVDRIELYGVKNELSRLRRELYGTQINPVK